MLYNLYMFDHNVLHICFWTLPAIIVGIIMIIMAAVHHHNQKKREQEFEEQLYGEMQPESGEAAAVNQ